MNSPQSETIDTEGTSGPNSAWAFVQWRVVVAALVLSSALMLMVPSPRMALLLLIGLGLGMTLQHGVFGFTSAYRNFLLKRDTAALNAQLLMLALATVAFLPLLSAGEFLGRPVGGSLAPFGLQVAIGSFIFGIGMQIGDGCGSGTLYKVGSGTTRNLITLLAFCVGCFVATFHMGAWQSLPTLPIRSLAEPLGYTGAALVQLGLLAVIAVFLRRWRSQQPVSKNLSQTPFWQSAFLGPWSLFAAAVILVALNLATLMTAGHPWSIAWGFTLWAAKSAALLGWDPSSSAFWSGSFQQSALNASVLTDTTSVMDIGIILGALAAAGLGGNFRPTLRLPLRSVMGALLGGLLMGYGARVAYGCNIGAYFSALASLSLHGWLWICCAIAGSAVGVRARPYFGLKN